VVQTTWSKPISFKNAIKVLHVKLSRTAKALRRWNKELIRWTKLVSAMADEVIFNLDIAQEDRCLTADERGLRQMLKTKLLGFAAVDRMTWRQRSRITWLREGDANTRFFHLRANGPRRKNDIPTLAGPCGAVFDHTKKA
jgi:hypothetical protein